MITKKILTLCQAGAVRSVTAAWIFRNKYKIDSIAQSLYRCSEETLDMLYKWADKIVVMETGMEDEVPLEHLDKVVIINVGLDVWKQSLHPDLVALLLKMIEERLDELCLDPITPLKKVDDNETFKVGCRLVWPSDTDPCVKNDNGRHHCIQEVRVRHYTGTHFKSEPHNEHHCECGDEHIHKYILGNV